MTDDPLDRHFSTLDELEAPPWRAATETRLADGLTSSETTAPGWGRGARALAIAAAVLLLLGVVAVLAEPGEGSVDVATEREAPAPSTSATTGSGAEPPTSTTSTTEPAAPQGPGRRRLPIPDDVRLVCPPHLIEFLHDDVEPALDSDAAPANQAWFYELSWEQDGHAVDLRYAGPQGSAAIGYGPGGGPPTETIELAGGRTGVLTTYGTVLELAVPAGNVHVCESVVLSSADEGARGALVAAADGVRISVPPGSTKVPDLLGVDQLTAQDRLARAGLIADPIATVLSAGGPPVVAQGVPAGTEVAFGSTVSFELRPTPPPTQPSPIGDPDLPTPDGEVICPWSRLDVVDDFRSQPTTHSAGAIEWDQPDGYHVIVRWPNLSFESGGSRARPLTIDGRPARMHDGGDGQNLVYDTGLPPGPCQYLEVGVYGGPSIAERERRAEALAANGITFSAPPTTSPPSVVGLGVAAAADRLARAGFIPDWGERRAVGDEPGEPPAATVKTQRDVGDGVVELTT